LSPDERRLFIFSDFHIGQVWDARSGEAIKPPFKYGDRGGSGSTLLSPDGKRAVNVGGLMRLWDTESGKPVADLSATSDEAGPAEFSSDSKQLATARGEVLSIWDGASGKLLQGPLQHDSPISMVRFSPTEGELQQWCETRLCFRHANGRARRGAFVAGRDVVAVRFSPDGHLIATASRNNSVRVWNADTGKPVTASNSADRRRERHARIHRGWKRLVVAFPKTFFRLGRQERETITDTNNGDRNNFLSAIRSARASARDRVE